MDGVSMVEKSRGAVVAALAYALCQARPEVRGVSMRQWETDEFAVRLALERLYGSRFDGAKFSQVVRGPKDDGSNP